jgi:hypothetical protein
MHHSPRTEAPAPPIYGCGPQARRFLKRVATKARRRSWSLDREVASEAEVPCVPTARRLSDIEREIEVCYVQREMEQRERDRDRQENEWAWHRYGDYAPYTYEDWEYHFDIDSLEYDAYVYDCIDDEEADLAFEAEILAEEHAWQRDVDRIQADEFIHEYDRWLRRHMRCERIAMNAKHRGRHYGRE